MDLLCKKKIADNNNNAVKANNVSYAVLLSICFTFTSIIFTAYMNWLF